MRTLWHSDARRRLVDRLGHLTGDAKPLWGRMNAPQMLAHVNDALRMAIGDLPVKARKGPLRYPPLRELVVYVLPFPKGVPTARELLARVDRAQFGEEAAAFPGLLERFADRAPDAPMPEHPAFGVMSRRAWGVLACRHVDHHFRQFGI
jgi:hypothetical protein